MPTSSTTGRREGIRSSPEVRQLLLQAARNSFSRNGYGGTTTRRIAKSAGVAEVMLFRHFGSKAAIYQESVIEPLKSGFQRIIKELAQAGYGDRPHDPERSAVYYVDHVFRFLQEHREPLLALLSSGEAADGHAPPEVAMFGSLFEQLERDVELEARAHGWDHLDVPMATRITFGIVTSMALLDGWFFDSRSGPPDRDRVGRAMAQYMIHGMAHRPSEVLTEPLATKSSPTRKRIKSVHGVSSTIRGAVATVTVDSPAPGIGLTSSTVQALGERVEQLRGDSAVRALVLTGTGASFCSSAPAADPAPDLTFLAEALSGSEIPTVAAVNGGAIGLGCAIAGLCDLVVMGDSAYYADAHIALEALAPEPNSTTTPFVTGLLRTKRHLLTGARIDARSALDVGLAHEIVPDDTVPDAAYDLALSLAHSPAAALDITRRFGMPPDG